MKGKPLLVLPTLNEETALESLVQELPEGFDVLVVDSGSTDRTVEIARGAGLKVLTVQFGKGQGSGVRTGMRFFLDSDYDYFITADCDYSDDLLGLPEALNSAKDSGLDVALGVRNMEKQRLYLGFLTILVKKTVSFLIRILLGIRLRDPLTGLWIINRKSVIELYPKLSEVGFEFVFDLTFTAWLLGLSVGEVDVNFRERKGKTKLTFSHRIEQVLFGFKYGLKSILARAS